ncbi:MAG: peptidyl-prolyl cis-trans isomerase [Flavobacteriaceae bacterium]|nr:peptidyl-prolyl cis-trans isomerase [Flavobacteriaceae bacterium]
MLRIASLLLLCLLVSGCDYLSFLKRPKPSDAVARVNETYLSAAELDAFIPSDASVEDSILLAQTFINRWATEKLLLEKSRINLSFEKQAELDRLIEKYKNDLYARAYKEVIVSQQLDTVIRDSEQLDFYKRNATNFRLNEDIYQLRFIQLSKNHSGLKSVTDKFKKFDAKSARELDSLSIQFNKANLNDSLWVRQDDVLRVIPVINSENIDEVLKKSQFSQLQDSLSVYLIFVKDKLVRNEIAPLSYVEKTLNQIILNQRTAALMKQLETDLTNDAIKDKTFEIIKPNEKP